MISEEETMPIFTAAGRMSSNTMSIWSATMVGSMFWMLRTPQVFCAVIAVMAHSANSPCAAMVLMSAWMPAPPLESEPAMVRTAGNVDVLIDAS